MTKQIEANAEGVSLFNAFAIGLSLKILSGKLDAYKDSPAYLALLDEFEKHHPNFKPKSWQSLKEWLLTYNDVNDIQKILGPVLFTLNQSHQKPLGGQLLDEIVQLVLKNKGQILAHSPWFSLDLMDSKKEVICPLLDSLDLKTVRTPLLEQLATLLKDKEIPSNPKELREFLEINAADLLNHLKEQALVDINPLHIGYRCEDLNLLSKALSIRVTENPGKLEDEEEVLHVIRNDKTWSVQVDDKEITQLFDRSQVKLKASYLEAYQGKTQVPAPTELELQQACEPSVILKDKMIDNPGLGNCAFYAFAIGLINIIQEEGKAKNKTTFNKWLKLDSSIEPIYEQLIKADIEHLDRTLLDRLQSSLRFINHYYQVRELKNNCANQDPKVLERNSNFVHFAALFYGNPMDIDPRFNPFARSKTILKELAELKDQKTAVEGHENDVLMPLFKKLIYKQKDLGSITFKTDLDVESPIVASMAQMTQDFFWGTHLDMDYLANAFEFNLHIIQDDQAIQQFVDMPDWHTITLQNKNNAHWTTFVTMAKLIPGIDIKNPGQKLEMTDVHTPTGDETPEVDDNKNKEDIEPKDNVTPAPEQKAESEQPKPDKKIQKVDERTDLEELARRVANATVKYTSYSSSIWFSLFHHHGSTGRRRAYSFNEEFSNINNLDDAKKRLAQFLSDNSNGNTYPRSFRTMLLRELKGLGEREDVLKGISNNFENELKKLDIMKFSSSAPVNSK